MNSSFSFLVMYWFVLRASWLVHRTLLFPTLLHVVSFASVGSTFLIAVNGFSFIVI